MESMKSTKKRLAGIVIAGALATVFGAARADAQITETLKFTTTFPFTIGHMSFPAGTYTIRPAELETAVMEISNGLTTKFLPVEPTGERLNDRSPDEIIFKKQGDTYVLSRVWDAAEHAGVEPVSSASNVDQKRHHHLG